MTGCRHSRISTPLWFSSLFGVRFDFGEYCIRRIFLSEVRATYYVLSNKVAKERVIGGPYFQLSVGDYWLQASYCG